MRRRDSFVKITYKDIDNIADVSDALETCFDLGIPLDGLDSIEEFRERIILHSKKRTGNRKRKVYEYINKQADYKDI